MKTHDIIVRTDVGIRLAKAETTAERPHLQCCAGCRAELVCHGCGETLKRYGRIDRCVSGACSTCCAKLHKHPQG